MSSGSYVKVDVRCPFFRGDDGRQRIVCEGIADKSVLITRFATKADWDIQIRTFCCRYYGRCEIYRMLMENKYGENENEF